MTQLAKKTEVLVAIRTVMNTKNIAHEKIKAKQEITDVVEAVQWLHQKMKLASRYTFVSDMTGDTMASGVGAGVGVALGAIGGPPGMIIGGAIGVGVGKTVAKLGAKQVFKRTGNLGLNKIPRGFKHVWKKKRGTLHVHRFQAAEILATEAYAYIALGRKPKHRTGEIAFHAICALFKTREAVEDLFRANDDIDEIKGLLAEILRS